MIAPRNRDRTLLAITLLAGTLAAAPLAQAGTFYEEEACDEQRICKEVVCYDDDGNDDGIPNVGETISCEYEVEIWNNTETEWSDIVVKDNMPADFDVVDGDCWVGVEDNLDCGTTLRGGSEQERVYLTEDSLSPDEEAVVAWLAVTDETPGGEQSFDSCGLHDINQGANLKYRAPKANGKGMQKQAVGTGELPQLCVLSADPDNEDCDGDLVNDSADEDPCDPCVPDAGSDACGIL